MIDTSNAKPREYICVFPVDISTKDTKVYAFSAVDVTSTALLSQSIEEGDGIEFLFKFIQQLIEDEKFKIFKNQPFTLILHKYEQYYPIIKNLIKPIGGSVTFDEEVLKETMTPFIKEFYKFIDENKPPSQAMEVQLPNISMDTGQFCFIDFVRVLPLQSDKKINLFLEYAKGVGNFRLTSDPVKLAEYLYKKLDPDTTSGFQKTFLLFSSLAKNNDIPEKYIKSQDTMLEGVNHILTLQNNDPKYPFADRLNSSRKKY